MFDLSGRNGEDVVRIVANFSREKKKNIDGGKNFGNNPIKSDSEESRTILIE